MSFEFEQKKENLKNDLDFLKKKINYADIFKKTKEIEFEINNPKFWEKENQKFLKEYQGIFKEYQKNKSIIEDIENLEKKIEECKEDEIDNLRKEIQKLTKKLIFNEPYDKNKALLSIYAGVGGKDAEDWVAILARMYQKFFEKFNFKYKITHEHRNEYGGYKNISFEVENDYPYGILKNESGVHRLVRISPFSAKKLRHTSFALVEVIPILEEEPIEINENDLEFDFFRSSGPGGQNVNKVETAVRVTYKPLNLSVVCQSERSQYQNRQKALLFLKSKLIALQKEKNVKKIEELKQKDIQPSWGYQTRSYIFHPYKLVKDHKTNKETQNLEEVLDGNLEIFLPYY
jgi:peptide chain release factor 2